jgi:hypothetical protein
MFLNRHELGSSNGGGFDLSAMTLQAQLTFHDSFFCETLTGFFFFIKFKSRKPNHRLRGLDELALFTKI